MSRRVQSVRGVGEVRMAGRGPESSSLVLGTLPAPLTCAPLGPGLLLGALAPAASLRAGSRRKSERPGAEPWDETRSGIP